MSTEREGFVDFMVRVPAEGAEDFRKVISKIPSYQILGELGRDQNELNELNALSELVQITESVLREGESVSDSGFQELYRSIMELARLRGKKPPIKEGFREQVVSMFKDSMDSYYSMSGGMKSNGGRGGTARYRTIEDSISPRHIRLLIHGYGLNGTRLPLDRIGQNEGFAVIKNNTNVRSAIHNATTKLGYAIGL